MSTATVKADTVIRNANVVTMGRPSTSSGQARPRAQAVAMSKGRIVGVGSNEDVETFIGPNVKVMDRTDSRGNVWGPNQKVTVEQGLSICTTGTAPTPT